MDKEGREREDPGACRQISVSKGKGARESWESEGMGRALRDAGQTGREPGTGILGLVPSTARKPQSFRPKRNFNSGPYEVLRALSPSLGE